MLPQVLPGLPNKARHQVQVVIASQLHVLQQILRIVSTKAGRKEEASPIGEHHSTARLLKAEFVQGCTAVFVVVHHPYRS